MNYEQALQHRNNLQNEASEYTKANFNYIIVPQKFEDRIRYLANYEEKGGAINDEDCRSFTDIDEFTVYGMANENMRNYLMNK